MAKVNNLLLLIHVALAEDSTLNYYITSTRIMIVFAFPELRMVSDGTFLFDISEIVLISMLLKLHIHNNNTSNNIVSYIYSL